MGIRRILFFLCNILAFCVIEPRVCLAGGVVWGAVGDTATINSLYRDARLFLTHSETYEKADGLINKAWKKSIEISYQEGVAEGYFHSAKLLEKRDSIALAIDYYEKALSIYLILDNVEQTVNTHLRLATLYAKQDQLFLAHHSYREALKTAGEPADSLRLVDIVARIEYADFKNNVERDYQGANLLVESVRERANDEQLERFQGVLYLIESDRHFYADDLSQSMYFAKLATDYFEKKQEVDGLIRAMLSQARIYHEWDNTVLLQETLQQVGPIDNKSRSWVPYQMLIIKLDLQLEEYELALARASRLSLHLQQRGNTNEAREVIALMANANYVLGRITEANSLFERFRHMSDSLLIEQFVQADAELSDKFIMARQEDVDRLKLSNTIYQRYGLIVSVVVLLAILVILYIHFREKDKLANRVAIKNAEISVQNEILKQANIQNELLLREIHHRVKNNLQMINSLLNLQARKTTLPEVVEIMKESRSRLNSIALIHNKLYQQYSLNKLNIHEYVEQLGYHLLSIYNMNNSEVDVCVDAEHVSLNVDTAIPVGLILTELITNSLKYAFVNTGNGSITISIRHGQNEDYTMVYADNGPGMPGGEASVTEDTLGFKLVRSLVDQLNGNIDYVYDGGWAKFIVHFRSHS